MKDLNWLEKDVAFVWHPFTHLKYAETPILITRSEGAYYFDAQGKKYIDGIASWWVNLHGHSHPYLVEKIHEQLRSNAHSIFSGFTHPGAILLAERLLAHLSGPLSKIFYSDNGSTAVEVAIKMALQFWYNQGKPKTKIIAFENAYHGDTFGGMSVGERNAFTLAFSPLLFEVLRLPVPDKKNMNHVLSMLKTYIREENVCAFIFEPLILGAGGSMQIYEASYLDELINLCKKNQVIIIADEVMTGFGRTGKFFASHYLKESADIICLSKGLTGGMMPLGVTACAPFIYEAYVSDNKYKTFFHGHSYTANPTACAAALASLDLMEKKETWENINRIAVSHELFKEKIKNHPALFSVRNLGTIFAIEIKTKEKSGYLNQLAEKISAYFIEKGILLRPLGNVLYILPPYCILQTDLDYIYTCVEEFLNHEIDH